MFWVKIYGQCKSEQNDDNDDDDDDGSSTRVSMCMNATHTLMWMCVSVILKIMKLQ